MCEGVNVQRCKKRDKTDAIFKYFTHIKYYLGFGSTFFKGCELKYRIINIKQN